MGGARLCRCPIQQSFRNHVPEWGRSQLEIRNNFKNDLYLMFGTRKNKKSHDCKSRNLTHRSLISDLCSSVVSHSSVLHWMRLRRPGSICGSEITSVVPKISRRIRQSRWTRRTLPCRLLCPRGEHRLEYDEKRPPRLLRERRTTDCRARNRPELRAGG